MTKMAYEISRAAPAEAGRIRFMQTRSMRILGAPFYSMAAIESFLRCVGTLDDALVAEGHYFVVKEPAGRIVGSGGWSQLTPGYARASRMVEAPKTREATIRAVYVDPDFCRQGIGTALMQMLERDSAAAGVEKLTLAATLSGLAMYQAIGYRPMRRHSLLFDDGAFLDVVDMDKNLGLARAA